MNRMVLATVSGLILAAAMAAGQEPTATDEADEPRREPARKIRVLENPYQIASFYRSTQGPSVPLYFGAAPLTDRAGLTERYPIASYYRQGGGNGGRYSRYWTASSGSTFGSSRRFPRRSRQVGPSELCLLAPTFLAPVAPLADIER
jgi:hypothetical protein